MKFLLVAVPFVAALFFSPLGAPPARAMEIQRVLSPGGIEAWLVEEHAVPLIVVEMGWEGGSRVDPEGKEGLATLVSGLLDEGAGPLDSRAFQTRLEETAVKLRFSADYDTFGGSLQTLEENYEQAFELLRLAISAPRFDPGPVERIRAQIKVTIAHNDQDPDRIAARAWYARALPGSLYARPSEGTSRSLGRITIPDLKSYAKRVLARDNLKISVVGSIDAATLGPLLDKTFGALPPHADLPAMADVHVQSKPSVEIISREMPQSIVVFGAAGLKRDDPDFIPAYVMNYVLGGGGFSARLMNEVREKRGLAYSVATYLYPLRHAGLFLGQVATENARVSQSLEVIREELRKMADEGITDRELADAKTYLTGSYPLRFDSNGSIAQQLVTIQTEHLGIDYVERRNGMIESVTQADIRRVARRLLAPDNLIVTVVGKPEGLKPHP